MGARGSCRYYCLGPIYLNGWLVYSIILTIILAHKHPIVNELFDMFGVNHGAEWFWLLPWFVA
jgi:hypothetical protein